MPDEPTISSRITELERRVRLLVRLSRLNLISMSDERVRGYCKEFQILTSTVESEDPAPEPEKPESNIVAMAEAVGLTPRNGAEPK